MKVFKFGGASVSTVERIQKVADIVRLYRKEKLLIVISAMGKTTNALEKVAEAFYNGNKEEALKLFQLVKDSHLTTTKYLLVTEFHKATAHLNDLFTEVEWLLHDKPVRSFDYYYDQIVCIGELISTTIVSHYFNEMNIPNRWIDVRDIFRTDDNFREGNIDWEFTQTKVIEEIKPLLGKNELIITQGFIGSTSENESTTLGREGSDYTAAIFANMLDAEAQVIWKDVEGVMNADPKKFKDAKFIAELNYDEVIEMAYYGAQVIHPKTIKPLQNKRIPLQVKCFLDEKLPGTIIHDKHLKNLPPIIVVKENQALIHLHSRDFSFVGEKPIADLYELFSEIKIKPNIIQTGAVTIQVCLDDVPDKIEKLAFGASEEFEVEVEKNLILLTIRHYTNEAVHELIDGRIIKLQQQSPETIQALIMSRQ